MLALDQVFAVPPLARTADDRRAIDFDENARIVRHLAKGGVRCLMYGGNAFLYHVTLREYEQLLEWLQPLGRDGLVCIPSAGPSFGRLMDQAPLLRRAGISYVMVLPCGDPRDGEGIGRGLREFAEACGARLICYVKDETNLGSDVARGLDVLARLVDEGICVGIKYAVVRQDPTVDAYLEALLRRVDRAKVISGIGERPAVVHLREWGLPGFTTGSGCVAPSQSMAILHACQRGDFAEAERVRGHFLPLEDLRDAWGPARVLHAAVELAEIARTGAIPPFVSALSAEQRQRLQPVARELALRDAG
ncbi:MAG: dihydrodipicolinate synthase family protein [Acidobacteriota bacterium]